MRIDTDPRAAGRLLCLCLVLGLGGCSTATDDADPKLSEQRAAAGPRWLAGDHHVHSRFSVGWNREEDPPAPIVGGDAIYPIPMNALMAQHYGVSWMVTTDHGGPGHSRVTRDWAYPALLRSRTVLPEVIQYHGLELNSPGGDHATLIVPQGPDEADQLFRYESAYDRNEIWPQDGSRNSPPLMVEALTEMSGAPVPPIVIANHPSRSVRFDTYGMYDPAELRTWNDTAPRVAIGFAGAPGHQAIALAPDGSLKEEKPPRGGFAGRPTRGGFDPMTAELGGLWDALLGEGRRWWITANSDSHRHYTEFGVDFWPGEYSKTWIHAAPTAGQVLESLRGGRVFVSTGDLVTGLSMVLSVDGEAQEVWPGDALTLAAGTRAALTISITDPAAPNAAGLEPRLARLDVIVGDVSGPATSRDADNNSSTQVAARFMREDMAEDGEVLSVRWDTAVTKDMYVRLRGTNTDELEPTPDPGGENPWSDLWFYSNPIFITADSGGSE